MTTMVYDGITPCSFGLMAYPIRRKLIRIVVNPLFEEENVLEIHWVVLSFVDILES
jgi:hypothetical protein